MRESCTNLKAFLKGVGNRIPAPTDSGRRPVERTVQAPANSYPLRELVIVEELRKFRNRYYWKQLFQALKE